MSDELSIQQQPQTTNTAAVLGGMTVGGLAGGLGAHYLTKPKYGSHEDIIKEAKDSADFSSKIEKAEGEEKSFLQAAKDVANEKTNAEKVWDDGFKEFQAAHSEGAPIENEEFKKKVAELDKKKADAIQKAEAELKAANTGSLTPEQIKAKTAIEKAVQNIEKTKSTYITNREKALVSFNKALNTDKGAKKIEDLVNEQKQFQQKIESIESHLKDKKFKKGSKLTFKDDKGKLVTKVPENTHEVKLAKKYFEEQYQGKLNTYFEAFGSVTDPKTGNKRPIINARDVQTQLLNDGNNVVHNLKTVNENTATRVQFIKDEVAKLQKAQGVVNNPTEITNVVGNAAKDATKYPKIAADWATYTTRDFDAEIAKLDPKKDATKIGDLRRQQANIKSTIQGHYNTLMQGQIDAKAKALGEQTLQRDIIRYNELANKASGARTISWGGFRHPGTVTIGAGLTPKEGTELKKLETALNRTKEQIGDKAYANAEAAASKADPKALEATIKNMEADLDALNKKVADRNTANKEIKRITKEFETIAGKGAHVNAAGELLLADGTKFQPKTSFKLATEVLAPANDAYLTKLENSIAKIKANIPNATKYTEEQIVQMAKEKVEKELAVEIKQLEDERAKLPKGAAKTETELLADYAKSKNVANKEEFVNNQVKGKTEQFVKDFEKQFQRKFGFAEHAGWKIAGVAAAGAALVGGLAYLMSPKNNEA